MTVRTGRRLLRLAVVPIAAAAAVLPAVASPAGAGGASNLPYALDGPLPSVRTSPPVDPRAPYTPTVLSLIKQLEPDSAPTVAELANAAKLFEGHIGAGLPTGPSSCKAVGAVNAPTGTTWGDSRAAYEHPDSVAALAGITPVTKESGKHRPSTSAGPATNDSAAPSRPSPTTADTPAPGPPRSTTTLAQPAKTTPTPSASWPAPGSASSGAAGKTAPPTTPPNTKRDQDQPAARGLRLTQEVSCDLPNGQAGPTTRAEPGEVKVDGSTLDRTGSM